MCICISVGVISYLSPQLRCSYIIELTEEATKAVGSVVQIRERQARECILFRNVKKPAVISWHGSRPCHVCSSAYSASRLQPVERSLLLSYPVHPQGIHILLAVALLMVVLVRRLRRAL